MKRESFSEMGRRMYRLSYWPELRRYVVFVARSVIHRRALNAMRDWFESTPLLAELANLYPYVYEQATRAFFYHRSALGERIALIETHMRFVADTFTDDACRKMYSLQRLPLWTYQCNERGTLEASLFFHAGQRKEGLMAVLLSFNGRTIYQLMFWWDGTATHIGAMQGPNGDDAREVVKAATKAAHGMRPKNLVIQVAQAMTRALGLPRVLAVTNEGYYANNHVRVDRKLKTDFTDFWLEIGGRELEGDNRFCELPLVEPRKTMDEVPTRKRAVYRRRFAMLDDMEEAVARSVAALRRTGNQSHVDSGASRG